MLLGRLVAWFRHRTALQVFLLEILAVFIGITASLLVENWRQDRIARATLDDALQEIFVSAHFTQRMARDKHLGASLALENVAELAFGDFSETDTDLLLEYLRRIFFEPIIATPPAGFERLLDMDILIEFDELRTSLDADYVELRDKIANTESMLDLVTDTHIALFKQAGIILVQDYVDPDMASISPRDQRALGMIRALRNGMGDIDVDRWNAESLLEALESEETRATLRLLVTLTMDNATEAWNMEAWAADVIDTIQAHAPGLRLPVAQLQIDGTATGRPFSLTDGPSNSIPMNRSIENPDLWELTVDLVDGALQFRADDSWEFWWGTPLLLETLDPYDPDVFVGDPSAVFPSGNGETWGNVIPVTSGRYRITFDLHTFNYTFHRISN